VNDYALFRSAAPAAGCITCSGGDLMLFLHYPPCSTCKKAQQWLDAHNLTYTARHIKENNPSYEELKQWLEASGLPIKKFFNTSGLVYKNLGLKDKLPTMTVDEQLRLLASDGMLVKRPLVVLDETVLTGFKESEWAEKLLK
jgi:arsenate reductase